MAGKTESLFPRFLFWLGLLAGAGLAVFALREWGFYVLAPDERPFHAHYAFLRSSGPAGLGFGLAGTVLVFLNLGYLARRRFLDAEWMGSLRHWMALHVFTGLVGGGMVLLHSAFAPRSALGTLAFYGLLIVVVTGLVGRYIYARVPRSVEGRELRREEIRRRLNECRLEMETLGLSQGLFEGPDGEDEAAGRSFWAALAGLVAGDREARREYDRLRETVLGSERLKPLAATLLPLARRYCRESQWLRRYNGLRRLMRSWRFFHRWFAVLMVVAVIYHVFIGVRLGELSIGKE